MKNVQKVEEIKRLKSENPEVHEIKVLLFRIGKKLGYEVDIEEEPETEFGKLGIRYDVIWYTSVPEWWKELIKISLKRKDLRNDYREYLEKKLKLTRLPVVAFEIEATDRSTKFMKGDIFNLSLVPFGVCCVLLGREEVKHKGRKEYIRNRFEKALLEFRKIFGRTNVVIVSFNDIQKLAEKIL